MTTIDSGNAWRGYRVSNPDGESLGTVEDFLVDSDLSHVRYAVVSFGGFLGLGHKHFAVPLEAMALDSENECFIVNVEKQHLEDAPDLGDSDWLAVAAPRMHETVYRYHGIDAKARGAP